MAMTPTQLNPCGSIGFSGAVPGGLQTCNDGTEAYVVGAAVVVQRQDERSVLEGAGKVSQRAVHVNCSHLTCLTC